MLAFFRRKTITVDCFLDSKIMADAYAIRKATKLTPEWWQGLPPTCPVRIGGSTETIVTAKKCAGFLSLYGESWMLPMWSDLIVETSSTGQYKFKYATSEPWAVMYSHPPEQYRGGFSGKIHFKIQSPWHVVEKRGVSFAFIPATWTLADDHSSLQFLPGILDFQTNHSVHVNVLAQKADARHQFSAGRPFVHLIPLTEKRVQFKTHAVTESEYLQMQKDASPRSLNKFLGR